ncbi:uncharacterized protein F4822DRAFT_435391 [Hypoxylon trugodes]|uniref:uncharacterized protein n=1 Tax=Hypoxylon trugodes TaxID=326681 RepID=UPI0021A18C26|nr:uncharacterized protein F4822DRAFT_435391 [Hypoxylon trugodes]KAI1382715.1 hypothetical protein F4822DRAFT_435391 [Hypoxylon trugodes]
MLPPAPNQSNNGGMSPRSRSQQIADYVFERLSVIDYNRTFPTELIDLLIMAAMRDEYIVNQIDRVYQDFQRLLRRPQWRTLEQYTVRPTVPYLQQQGPTVPYGEPPQTYQQHPQPQPQPQPQLQPQYPNRPLPTMQPNLVLPRGQPNPAADTRAVVSWSQPKKDPDESPRKSKRSRLSSDADAEVVGNPPDSGAPIMQNPKAVSQHAISTPPAPDPTLVYSEPPNLQSTEHTDYSSGFPGYST